MIRNLMFLLLAAIPVCATSASAQAANFMNTECTSAAQAYFRDSSAATDMEYEGRRGDGTYLFKGRIYLKSRVEEVACSFDRDGARLLEFFADGRWRPNPLADAGKPVKPKPPTSGMPSDTDLQRIVGVPVTDVLNMRDGPGMQYRVVGILKEGEFVVRLTCRPVASATWCEVRKASDMHTGGWVNARYLAKVIGSAADKPKPPTPGAGQITTTFVRFPHGANRVALKEQLPPKATRRYVLRARAGQELTFRVESKAQQMSWRLLGPDGSLIARNSATRDFRGKLRKSGEYVVEVTNGGVRTHGYDVIFRID